ncbi:hypothetical protein GON04_04750 [Ramlibacter sp. MAH-25]|uniref:DUF1223 domain-containing protein n=1 Tax=Ramlibacter pinisoli TaxID=2682844 RepID=A0A6N8IPE2_9BURK|nr:hypothetical protein [Ramlibacter sp. CGMCC 1.13660]MVQ28741.1 hypothetical protein [Ramlibacter pinisoli]
MLLVAAGSAVRAQSSCSSDGRPAPAALLERFITADCDTCWAAPDAARARLGELALDWIVPGAKGEDAPLAAAARSEAQARLEALGRGRPLPVDTARGRRQGRSAALRVAHGLPFNGYIGASIELKAGGPGPWTGWLALVESLPAGTEGTPVARNLVRNVLQVSWPAGTGGRRLESRPMNIPEGAHLDRLRVVGWLEDARGVIRAISESVCAGGDGRR